MRSIGLIAVGVAIMMSAIYCKPQCGCGSDGKRGDLTIVPIDGLNNVSDEDAYSVKKFIDLKSNIDRSYLFGRRGKGALDKGYYYAAQVPFGRYRIELQSRSNSDSFGRVIDVCQQDERVEVPRQSARVHIVPLLVDGSSVDDGSTDSVAVTKFQNTLDGTEMSGLFKQGVADQIPYGNYDLEFALPLGIIKREVDVFQPDVWVFSGSQGFYGDTVHSGPANIVRGEVKNIPANERPVFMTLSGVYVSYMINSVVSDADGVNGTFSFTGANPTGVFTLYTIGRSGVLDVREFRLPREAEITIDLSHSNPPKIDVAQ